jgi:hypothetical protein
LLITYDYGVASIFKQSQGREDEVLGTIQYAGILKEILQLNYGLISSPITLFHCQRVKNETHNRRNPTYMRDDVGFFLANFLRFLHEFDEPFVFLSKVQQVYFLSDTKTPFWKVVLHKEPKSQQVMANIITNLTFHDLQMETM